MGEKVVFSKEDSETVCEERIHKVLEKLFFPLATTRFFLFSQCYGCKTQPFMMYLHVNYSDVSLFNRVWEK